MLGSALILTTALYLTRPPADIAEPPELVVSVDAAQAVKQSLRIPIQAQGTITPLRETTLVSEVNGRILEVSDRFNAGEFVKKGELLLKIDPRNYEAALLRAKAAVATARSTLAQEKGRAEVAAREWRNLPSSKRQRSDDAKALYLRKPQLEQAEAQLLSAQADLSSAENDLERTEVRAPYDALIRSKQSELGKFVSAGSALAALFSIEAAELRLPIAQSRLPFLELPDVGNGTSGADIDLYTDVAGEITHWNAKLQRTEGIFDERSRSLYAVARIEDPYNLAGDKTRPLRIGTFVNASIAGREISDIVVLPRYVLRAGNNVWVVDEQQRLRNRAVTLLNIGGDQVYISAGLDAGERISLTTLDASFEGAKVTIQSEAPSDQLDASGRRKTPPVDTLVSEQVDIETLSDESQAAAESIASEDEVAVEQ